MDADRLQKLLTDTQYDRKETSFLVNGFKHGFSLHYQGPWQRKDKAKNIPFTVGDNVDMWNKIMKEVQNGRVAGPLEEVPFQFYVQSPIGLVPKADNKTRLIFHLSYKFQNGNESINFWIPKDKCSTKYNDLDHAISNCLSLIQSGASILYYSKTDLMSAFRMVPLAPKWWKYLIMSAQDPVDKRWKFFVDKNLPFGSSISCSHFQRFSNALKHIIEVTTGIPQSVTNYLDDYLFIQRTKQACNAMVRRFLSLCQYICLPVVLEKTEWATTRITFLGVLLDGERFCLAIPEDKRVQAFHMVMEMKDRKKATVKQLQRLAGLLNFLCKAIHPGRPFIRHMYAKFSKTVDLKNIGGLGPLTRKQERLNFLKHFHHVRLDSEFKHDCEVWGTFLTNQYAVVRPMIDLDANTVHATKLQFFMDASLSEAKGFGCYFAGSWTFGKWEPGFIRHCKPSIAYVELFALVAGILMWQDKLQNCRIQIFCDNQTVRSNVNNLTAGCKNSMYLIRLLTLNNLQFNRRVFVEYIETRKNSVADALSRLQLKRFFREARKLNDYVQPTPCKLPGAIWPISKIWIK